MKNDNYLSELNDGQQTMNVFVAKIMKIHENDTNQNKYESYSDWNKNHESVVLI